MSSSDKKSIVKKYTNGTIFWNKARLPDLATLVTMIVKRDFEGDTSQFTIRSATNKLIPFVIPLLTDTKIDNINEQEAAKDQATLITTKESYYTNKLHRTHLVDREVWQPHLFDIWEVVSSF